MALKFHCYGLIVYVGAKMRAISRLDIYTFHYTLYLESYVYGGMFRPIQCTLGGVSAYPPPQQ